MSTTEQPVPDAVTFREVREILRTFHDSGWTGMTVELHGMRITVGKHGRPGTGDEPARPGESTVREPAPRRPEPGNAPSPSGEPTEPAQAARRPDDSPSRSGQLATAPAAVDIAGCVAVRSPAVGAFWVAPSPGQPPFVQVGEVVEADQQLAIVEVMKLMNPVTAPVAGTVVRIGAADAELVEYEQPLFWIRPADG